MGVERKQQEREGGAEISKHNVEGGALKPGGLVRAPPL